VLEVDEVNLDDQGAKALASEWPLRLAAPDMASDRAGVAYGLVAALAARLGWTGSEVLADV
jgi:hypothetical protein